MTASAPPPDDTGNQRSAGPLGSEVGSTPTAGAAGPSYPPQSTQPDARTRSRGRGIGLTLAAALLVFVTVVLVLFVLFNTQTVDISLVFGDVRAPLVLALVIAAALGFLLATFLSAYLAARRSRNR
jgi:uncharacterized integral membrane protein